MQLLESGGATQYSRAVLLAELLLQDAAASEANGQDSQAIVSRSQAQALLAHAIDALSPEEQAIYWPKLGELTAALERGDM